jgi:hypothetical protein
MHDTAAASGHDTEASEPAWFRPGGLAQGERSLHRARGWIIVAVASVVLWAGVAIAVVAVVSAIN